MNTKSRGGKIAKRGYLVVALASLVVVGSFALIHSAIGSPSVPQQIANLSSCGIYPKVSLSNGTASEAVKTPLSLLAESSLGTAAGPPFQSDGLPTLHSDNNSAKLSIYQTAVSGVRTVVVTATNVGTRPLNVTSLIVFGMTKTTGFEYSTVFFGRVIDPVANDIGASNCHGLPPATSLTVILFPGQSITGIMAGSGTVNGAQVDGFQPVLIYYPVGNSTLRYIDSPDVTWIT
ncbi:MAG: hypothetical protein KGI38_07695 [Thaumarchaeota archaeon]|nr:hypothetical protein [Nitrososphaerota archaeon]